MAQYSRTKNSVLSLVTGIGGQLVNEALRFITRTVFIITLGKIFLGINGLFSEIMAMLALTELGFGTAIIYRLYKPLAIHDEKQIRILLRFYKKAYQSIGLIILTLGLCLLPFLKKVIKDYDSLGDIGLNAELVYLLFLGQSVCTYFFYAYRTSILTASQKQYIVNTTEIIGNIICSVFQIGVLYLWGDFILYLLVKIGTGILKNLLNGLIAYRLYPNCFTNESDSLSRGEIYAMIKDCGALFIYKLNGVIQKSTGNLILSAFIGLSTVAVYSNYLIIYTAIRLLGGQLFNAVKGSMGNLYATSSVEQKYSFFELMNFLTMLIFGSIGVNIAVNCNELIMVWLGDDYVIEQPYPILMGIEILVLGLETNLNQIRNITGLFRQMWFRPVISIIVNLIAALLMVQYIGVFAIPLGYIIAVSFTNLIADPIVIHNYVFENVKPTSGYYLKCFKYVCILLLSALCGSIICTNLFDSYSWCSFLVKVIICELITLGMLLAVCHKSKECNDLLSRTEKILNKISCVR